VSTQESRTDRYRRVLALLPRAYLEQRGEEMLAVMLDGAEGEGRDRPSAGELLSVLGLSLRLRTGAPGASPRARSVGEMLRLITLIGLLLQAAAFASAPAQLPHLWISPIPGLDYAANFGRFDLWHVVGDLSGFVCPFLALAALSRGERRLGLVLTTNALVLVSSFPPHLDMFRYPAGFLGQTYAAVALCVIPTVSGLLGFHREAPRVVRPRRWFTAVFALAVPLVVLDSMPIARDWALASNVFAVVCGCAAVGIALSRTRSRGGAWPAALMVVGSPMLLMLPESMNLYTFGGSSFISRLLLTDPSTFVALVALAVEVLLAVALAVSLARRLRRSGRLPAELRGQR